MATLSASYAPALVPPLLGCGRRARRRRRRRSHRRWPIGSTSRSARSSPASIKMRTRLAGPRVPNVVPFVLTFLRSTLPPRPLSASPPRPMPPSAARRRSWPAGWLTRPRLSGRKRTRLEGARLEGARRRDAPTTGPRPPRAPFLPRPPTLSPTQPPTLSAARPRCWPAGCLTGPRPSKPHRRPRPAGPACASRRSDGSTPGPSRPAELMARPAVAMAAATAKARSRRRPCQRTRQLTSSRADGTAPTRCRFSAGRKLSTPESPRASGVGSRWSSARACALLCSSSASSLPPCLFSPSQYPTRLRRPLRPSHRCLLLLPRLRSRCRRPLPHHRCHRRRRRRRCCHRRHHRCCRRRRRRCRRRRRHRRRQRRNLPRPPGLRR